MTKKEINKKSVLKRLKYIESYARPIYKFKNSIEEITDYVEQQSSNRAILTLSMLVGYSEDYCFRVIYNGDEIEIDTEVFNMPLSGIWPINEELMEIHIDDDAVLVEDVVFKEVKE